jgi:hypothetical protein
LKNLQVCVIFIFVTAVEALIEVQGCAKYGRYRFLPHAMTQAKARGFSLRDVVDGLVHAKSCQAEGVDRWRAGCCDLDGDPFDVIVEFEGEMVIITVFAR